MSKNSCMAFSLFKKKMLCRMSVVDGMSAVFCNDLASFSKSTFLQLGGMSEKASIDLYIVDASVSSFSNSPLKPISSIWPGVRLEVVGEALELSTSSSTSAKPTLFINDENLDFKSTTFLKTELSKSI